MADVITGNTQLGPTKQDVIAAIVQKELKFAAKLLPYVSDMSMFAGKGAQTVKFPKLTSFTVVDRASAAAGDASVLTSSVDTLALDLNAYVSWIIDSSDEIQTMIDAQIAFAQRAASAHGRYVDEQLILKAEAVGVATTTPGNITRDIVLEMRKALLKNDGDMAQSVFMFSPDQEEALLKIAEFTSAQVYGQPVIPNGMVGRLYGIPVVIHNGLATQQYFLAEKSGLAIAFQKNPMMAEQAEIQYGTSAKRVAMDQLFGVCGLQLGEKGVGATLSPMIIKDNN
jgi:hypothetical protein